MENNVERIDLDRVDWKSSREFFESLGDALDKLDNKDESYNFTWVGKRKSIIEAGAPINKALRPDIEVSKNFGDTKNILIVGDNLDALKILQESYLSKIKMIYIDPPYNTGHDFVYHDNFTVKKEDYTDSIVDENGNKLISEDPFRENSKANGRFHSDWLSMIYPRLRVAKNLLSEDGVIFISIDDNEYSNLKKVCDEIFGDENVETMIWRKVGDGDAGAGKMKITYRFRIEHEYIICCYKDISKVFFKKNKEIPNFKNSYGNPDNDPRGPYKAGNISKNDEKSNPNGKNYYTVTSPSGKTFSRQWHFDKAEFDRLDADGRIYWGKNKDSVPGIKIFVNEPREVVPTSILLENGSATMGNKTMDEMFGDVVFDNSKPVKLIRYLVDRIDDNDFISMDFFAGSGTMGEAIMEANAEDNGKRKFILVQLNEKAEEKTVAKKSGFNTIDEVTSERLRKVGDKISNKETDTGFRVFTIDSSNENDHIHKPLNQISQSDLFSSIENVKNDRTPLDLLFGVVYTSAFPFDLKLETRKMGDNTVYLYGYLDEETGLVACFDNEVPEATVKEIAELKPLTAAFRDSSFKDSAEKINLSEHFRVISPNTKVKVI